LQHTDIDLHGYQRSLLAEFDLSLSTPAAYRNRFPWLSMAVVDFRGYQQTQRPDIDAHDYQRWLVIDVSSVLN
jgi:hypothetical protein